VATSGLGRDDLPIAQLVLGQARECVLVEEMKLKQKAAKS